METIEKLKILSQDSQYDLACACGTSSDDRRKRGLDGKWLYPVTLPGGGYSVLLKTQRCTPKIGQSYKVVKYTTKRRRIHRYEQDKEEQVFSGFQSESSKRGIERGPVCVQRTGR